MKILSITDDYNSESNNIHFVEVENDNFDIIVPTLLLWIPGGIVSLSLIGLMIWSTPNPFVFTATKQ